MENVPVTGIPAQPVQQAESKKAGGPVNPFAKKRGNDENIDNANKMARNA